MNIHKAIGIGGTIVHFLNRRGGTNLQEENSNNRESANFLGGSPDITYWRSYSWVEHFVPLCLFVKTLPVASGNGNMFFTQKWLVQIANNPRSPQSQTESQWWSPPDPPHFSLPSSFNRKADLWIPSVQRRNSVKTLIYPSTIHIGSKRSQPPVYEQLRDLLGLYLAADWRTRPLWTPSRPRLSYRYNNTRDALTKDMRHFLEIHYFFFLHMMVDCLNPVLVNIVYSCLPIMCVMTVWNLVNFLRYFGLFCRILQISKNVLYFAWIF